MPYKSGGKWKWGNIERSSKEDLRKTVYGIWMKNGGEGSFSKFWKTGKVSESEKAKAKSMSMPTILYHATYAPLVTSIKEEGLGGKSAKPNWPDSKEGVTYWSIDPDVAYSYAESAEDVDESWLDQIVVFACAIKDFDVKKLFVDANVIDNDGVTLEYHGIMPYEKLKRTTT